MPKRLDTDDSNTVRRYHRRVENSSNDGNSQPPSIEEFVNENYRLFTVISVFGALAAYFAQLPASNQSIQYGVGGSLILFLITSSIALKKVNDQREELLSSDEKKPLFQELGYTGFLMGFLGIAVSILSLMMEEYPNGSGNLLQGVIMMVVGTAYITFLINRITEFRGYTKWQHLVRLSPTIAGIPLLLLFTMNWLKGETLPLMHENPGIQLGYISGLALFHALFTLVIASSAFALDALAKRAIAAFDL